ncbi:FAD/NAD(P)-binding domain-containing protein [Xylaria sp. FL1042]|nr:FAD/NAD(P)-binding domain-containing protein [Xylaria sp. FL1042]
MPLRILIIGAGVCGPAFAALLRRADPSETMYEITIVERAPKLRETGLQIDLRSHGIPIVRKMGLIDEMRKRTVPEQGMSIVDDRGRMFATFGKNDSGHGAQTMTSEYEIMRGDLVDVFYKASLGVSTDAATAATTTSSSAKAATVENNVVSSGNVRYEFGVTVTALSQHDADAVDVTFSDGRTGRYDLVVGADGQGSRTRRAILGGKDASDACFKSLDLFAALYLIPRSSQDTDYMLVHAMPGRRAVFTRSADAKAPTQVYMAVQTSRAANAYGVATALAQSPGEQKRAFARAFADHHGWRVDELADALENKTPDEDFYATEIGQVRCEKLAVGRVVLLGDAGYCPSPITGMGTTLSLVGAYLLAGELVRHGRDGVPEALMSYARGVRPFVNEGQKLVPGFPGVLYAESRWGVWIITTIFSIIARLRIFDLLARFFPENSGRLRLPEYPELNLGS